MKKYIFYTLLAASVFALGCSSSTDGENDDDLYPGDGDLSVESVSMSLKAAAAVELADFAVNDDDLDPTKSLDFRTDWILDVTIYKGSGAYNHGHSTFTYDSTDEVWYPDDTDIRWPNYSSQGVAATLIPQSWGGKIDPDQKTADKLRAQDLLSQNAATTVTIAPTHRPTIPMRHSHSMLNFILADVEGSELQDLAVYVEGVRYDPYTVAGSQYREYMVIIPVGTVDPLVTVKTTSGAQYTREVEIDGTQINTCYCFILDGIELLLAGITVSNWAYGEATAGTYTSVTSYPTFSGPPNESLELVFQNGLKQTITFNNQGQTTVKPYGRTIVEINYNGRNIQLPQPISLRNMSIDLFPYL